MKVLALLLGAIIVSGCASTQYPQTLLTSSQLASLSNRAVDVHLKNIELTENERVFVENTLPVWNYYIMAYPYAQYNFIWNTPDGRTINVHGTGNIEILENAKVSFK